MDMSDPPQLSAFADKYEMESNEYLSATFEIKDSTSGMIDIAVNGESIFIEQYYFDTQEPNGWFSIDSNDEENRFQ